MAFTFNDGGDYITIGTVALPTTGSISFWIKPTWAQTDGVEHEFFEVYNGSEGANHFVIMKYSDNSLYMGWFTSSVSYRVAVTSANYTLNQNAWNHFVLTWNDTTNETKAFLN